MEPDQAKDQKMIGIYIDVDDRDILKTIARSHDRSMSSFIRVLLRREIEKWKEGRKK